MTFVEPSPERRLRMMLWIGAGAAALAALAGMFGFHDASVWRAPGALQTRVEAALQAGGYPGIDVDMDGQKAILRGIVADEASIEAASRLALRAAGPGGAWSGGITSIDASGLSVGVIEQPFAWRIRRDDTRLVLSGAIPSEAARADLMAAAASSFPNAERVDDMHVAGGAPSSNWTEMARSVIRALALLHDGEARMTDRQVALMGDGPYEAVERLRADYAAPAPPFRAHLAVTADGLDLAYPELQGINLHGGDAEACGRAFTRIEERAAVTFAPASAAIESASLPALEALASIALRCDSHDLNVRGPGEGGAALSHARAEALVNHLAAIGVARDHLRASVGGRSQAQILVTGGGP